MDSLDKAVAPIPDAFRPTLRLTPPILPECSQCGDEVSEDESDSTYYTAPCELENHFNGLYCGLCAESYLRVCEHCELTIRKEDAMVIDRSIYCLPCYDAHFFLCESCGTVTSREEMCSVVGDDDGMYCGSCCAEAEDEDEDEEFNLIHNSSTDVLDFCLKLGSPIDGVYYGIELEVETEKRSESAEYFLGLLDNYAIIKEDGSLSNGWELVTAPATIEIHKKELAKRFLSEREAIREYGLSSATTKTCGMHVHISRGPLTNLQIGKMQVFLHNPANRSFIEVIAQRNPEVYASFAGQKKVVDVLKGSDSRYTALNLQNDNTVEVRIFRGNLRVDRVFKNLEFCAALVAWCATGVSGIADCAEHGNFIQWVAPRKKDYPYLVAYLMETTYLSKKANPRAVEAPITGEDACV